MTLVLDWQQRLGYRKDPFSGPAPDLKALVGVHAAQERLNLFLVKEERFGTITGELGTGKTTLLHWLDAQLKPKRSHTQQLLDGTHRRDELVRDLLQGRLTILERAFGGPLRLPQAEQEKTLLQRLARGHNVLLVDNGESLGPSELALLCEITAKTSTQVIIAATTLVLPAGLEDTLQLRTPHYAEQELHEILRARIEDAGGKGTSPFSEDELRTLLKDAAGNPGRLLSIGRERAMALSVSIQPQKEIGGKFIKITVQKGEPPATHTHHRHATAQPASETPVSAHPSQADLALLAKAVRASEPVPAPTAQPTTPAPDPTTPPPAILAPSADAAPDTIEVAVPAQATSPAKQAMPRPAARKRAKPAPKRPRTGALAQPRTRTKPRASPLRKPTRLSTIRR